MLLIAGTPILTFITLSDCRNIANGKPMLLNMWLEPLRERETRRRYLALGLAYLIFCLAGGFRSEERRGGKECVSKCRPRRSREHEKQIHTIAHVERKSRKLLTAV